MGILIQGGRIVDAATDTDKTGDIYLKDGIITEIGQKLKKKDGDIVINAKGLLVMPGIIDLHVHFRDPGQTHKEDIMERFCSSSPRWCDNRSCHAQYNSHHRQSGQSKLCT